MNIVKIGNVELTEEEAKKIYEEHKYVCSYTGIFQVFYSAVNRQYYGHKVIDCKGYARRGRFYVHDGATVNRVLGHKILIED